MTMLHLIFAALAAFVHIWFFLIESIWWMKPSVNKLFGQNESQAATMQGMAYNQGFYNLFLALGTLFGMVLVLGGNRSVGFTIISCFCSVMLGAAIILYISSPRMLRGALVQGIPPLFYFLSFLF